MNFPKRAVIPGITEKALVLKYFGNNEKVYNYPSSTENPLKQYELVLSIVSGPSPVYNKYLLHCDSSTNDTFPYRAASTVNSQIHIVQIKEIRDSFVVI